MEIKEKIKLIRTLTNKRARFTVLAEELMELAQASLKLARHYDDKNPTDDNYDSLIWQWRAEYADVTNAIDVAFKEFPVNDNDPRIIGQLNAYRDDKMTRWLERLLGEEFNDDYDPNENDCDAEDEDEDENEE